MAALSNDVLHGEAALPALAHWATVPTAPRADCELIAAVAKGDEHALGELYDRFSTLAYALALRVLHDRQLAEDAVQEAFLSVWRSAARFDDRRGSARAWILMLAHRRAVDLVQTNQRHRTRASEQTDEPLGPSVADTSELDTERRRVQGALASLPVKQRTVLDLAYYAGYTQQEIAAHLDAPVGTIKSQTFDGLRRLRRLLAPTERRPA